MNDELNMDLHIPLRKERQNCTQYPLSHFASYDKLSSKYRSFVVSLTHLNTPKTYAEAVQHEEGRQAMNHEMEPLKKKTWELVTMTIDKKAVGCRWVYIVKYKETEH